MRARSWANVFAGHPDRGARSSLSAFARPEHPCCEENDHRPRHRPVTFPVARRRALVRPCGYPRSRRQDASNPFLQPTFRVTSTHDKHHLWRLPVERRGKPADVRLRDPPRTGLLTLSQAGAGPPCGHPASSDTALDGATPASGPSAATRPGAVGWSAAAFLAGGSFADRNPLAPLVGGRGRGRRNDLAPGHMSPFRRGHVNATAFPSSRCLPSHETATTALSSARVERCPRWPAESWRRTCSPGFSNLG